MIRWLKDQIISFLGLIRPEDMNNIIEQKVEKAVAQTITDLFKELDYEEDPNNPTRYLAQSALRKFYHTLTIEDTVAYYAKQKEQP